MKRSNKRPLQVTLKRSLAGIIFLLPAVAFLAYTIYFPVVWNMILSFQQWDGYLKKKWVGLNNFITAFHDPDILHSL